MEVDKLLHKLRHKEKQWQSRAQTQLILTSIPIGLPELVAKEYPISDKERERNTSASHPVVFSCCVSATVTSTLLKCP